MAKLTKAQTDTLLEIDAAGPSGAAYADHYPPIRKLLERGFIGTKRLRFSDVYVITPAGRTALSEPRP